MKLSLGMATYDDYDGVYFTVQAIRTYHPEAIASIELIVVDNHPGTKTSEAIQHLLDPKKMGGGFLETKYVPMAEPIGTTQPRNRIFEEATGDVVMCIDSHILLYPNTLLDLFDFFAEEDGSQPNIYSGPIMYDNGSVCGTHFDDMWRGQMWGTWGHAWACPCGQTKYTIINTDNRADYRELSMGLAQANQCPSCDKELPDQPFSGHERRMSHHGFTDLAYGEDPFEIPGMGLGLFACHRKHWQGFNPHFRGFGGEEMYIHEKFRQAGGKAICLPWLKWGHRFGRPNGTPYLEVCTNFNKARNYILGLREINVSAERCWNHLVRDEKCVHPAQWGWIEEDPVNNDSLEKLQAFIKKKFPGIQFPSPEKREQPKSNTLQSLVGTGEP